MVLPLIIAGAGMAGSFFGNQMGAQGYQSQLNREMAQKAALDAERRDSIRTALAQASPAAQYDRAHGEAQVYRGQQDENQAIGKAYGIDNPALGDAIAQNGQTINDRAWQRAFGITGSDVGHALADDTSRQHGIDAKQAWWNAFLQNRLQRAGAKGEWLRFLGKAATATGLGLANRDMSQPAGDGGAQAGSDATNAETGNRITDGLNDRSWLWGSAGGEAGRYGAATVGPSSDGRGTVLAFPNPNAAAAWRQNNF